MSTWSPNNDMSTWYDNDMSTWYDNDMSTWSHDDDIFAAQPKEELGKIPIALIRGEYDVPSLAVLIALLLAFVAYQKTGGISFYERIIAFGFAGFLSWLTVSTIVELVLPTNEGWIAYMISYITSLVPFIQLTQLVVVPITTMIVVPLAIASLSPIGKLLTFCPLLIPAVALYLVLMCYLVEIAIMRRFLFIRNNKRKIATVFTAIIGTILMSKSYMYNSWLVLAVLCAYGITSPWVPTAIRRWRTPARQSSSRRDSESDTKPERERESDSKPERERESDSKPEREREPEREHEPQNQFQMVTPLEAMSQSEIKKTADALAGVALAVPAVAAATAFSLVAAAVETTVAATGQNDNAKRNSQSKADKRRSRIVDM